MSDPRFAGLDVGVVRQLEALRNTIEVDNEEIFWTAVDNFPTCVHCTITLLYFRGERTSHLLPLISTVCTFVYFW